MRRKPSLIASIVACFRAASVLSAALAVCATSLFAQTYQTLSFGGGSYVIDLPTQCAGQNGCVLQVYLSNGGPQQYWALVPVPGTNYYNIVNQLSGLLMDMPTQCATIPNGICYVQQFQADGGPQQNWQLSPVGNGTSCYYIDNELSGLGLKGAPNNSNTAHIEQAAISPDFFCLDVSQPAAATTCYSTVNECQTACAQAACNSYTSDQNTEQQCTDMASFADTSCYQTADYNYYDCVDSNGANCNPQLGADQAACDSSYNSAIQECQLNQQDSDSTASLKIGTCQSACYSSGGCASTNGAGSGPLSCNVPPPQ